MADNKVRLIVRDETGGGVIEQDEQGRWQWCNGAGLVGGGHLSRSDRALTGALERAVRLLLRWNKNWTGPIALLAAAESFLLGVIKRDPEPPVDLAPSVTEEDLHDAIFSGGIPAAIKLLEERGVRVVR